MKQDPTPETRIDQVSAPTIVLHSANDFNVPVVDAEQMVNSFQARGVPVRYILFLDEGHSWQKTENRVTSTVEIDRWYDR